MYNFSHTHQYANFEELLPRDLPFEPKKGLPVLKVADLLELLVLNKGTFLGNGAEGFCLKFEDSAKKPYCAKLYYGAEIPQEVSKSILDRTTGADDCGVFWNPSNRFQWSSNVDWHVKQFERYKMINNTPASQRVIHEILALKKANSLCPDLVDSPVGVILGPKMICGLVTPLYEGNFCTLNDVISEIRGDVDILTANGILLDFSNEGCNAVRTLDSGIKLLDLELDIDYFNTF